jgi:SAM-dependent methyltransferase
MDDSRPLYHRFAWAYDLVINEPIDTRLAGIVSLLSQRGVRPPDELLDAGCGTGRYASELAARGFTVSGFDCSAEMIEMARKRPVRAAANLEFSVGNLTSFTHPRQLRAILCRGVLNDLLADHDRGQVARQFARLLTPGGVLLLDVRDWQKTADRYRTRPGTARAIDLADGGHLLLQSETTLDEPSTCQMKISEMLQFRRAGSTTIESHTNEFRMRCWSAPELHECFRHWFESIDTLPDYIAPPAWTDRLVLVATRNRQS